MPSDLNELIERLSNSRNPDNALGEISSDATDEALDILSLEVKASRQVGDWLNDLAEEIGVDRTELVTVVFNDGLQKLHNADAEITPATPSAPSDGLGQIRGH